MPSLTDLIIQHGHCILEHNKTSIMKISFENMNMYHFSVGSLLISRLIFISGNQVTPWILQGLIWHIWQLFFFFVLLLTVGLYSARTERSLAEVPILLNSGQH